MKNYMELITKNIIRRKSWGNKSVKPETIEPAYADEYDFEAYDAFNEAAYELFERGVVQIIPVREYKSAKKWNEDIKKENKPMIKKIVFVDGKEEELARLYINSKYKKG